MTDEAVVRAAFDALKADDRRVVAAFDAVRARATTKRSGVHRVRRFTLVAAGALTAAVAATYTTRTAATQRFTVPAEVVALGAWRPATDALLPCESTPLGAGPGMGRSMLDLDPLTTGAFR